MVACQLLHKSVKDIYIYIYWSCILVVYILNNSCCQLVSQIKTMTTLAFQHIYIYIYLSLSRGTLRLINKIYYVQRFIYSRSQPIGILHGFYPAQGGGVRESVNVLLLGISYIGCTSLILSREAVTKLESVIARVGTSQSIVSDCSGILHLKALPFNLL